MFVVIFGYPEKLVGKHALEAAYQPFSPICDTVAG
jgi:hypothetical protein